MPVSPPYHIVVAGNIGVGKSTLVHVLAERLGWTPIDECAAAHPYLDDYYADPPRWGFHAQLWFLTQRFIQHQVIASLAGPVVQDRSIYEDALVFAASLFEQGILSDRDYATYQQLYGALVQALHTPQLIVYLRAGIPTLLQRIARRARPAEQAIPPSYLRSLEQHYERWIAGWTTCPILTIDTDPIDIVQDTAARQALIAQIVDCVPGTGAQQ